MPLADRCVTIWRTAVCSDHHATAARADMACPARCQWYFGQRD
ncbi:hypothetical protein QJS66_06905 [Kocuria rhizophila]|nr:hypothetical protein QJS66_06905 [Kocuria rhizophila]